MNYGLTFNSATLVDRAGTIVSRNGHDFMAGD
jgi:hypothetical protein